MNKELKDIFNQSQGIETFDNIKKGQFGKIGEKTLSERVETVKKEYANEHPKYRSNIKQD